MSRFQFYQLRLFIGGHSCLILSVIVKTPWLWMLLSALSAGQFAMVWWADRLTKQLEGKP